MKSFGQLLRELRRECRDPLRGGLLTQERFGELIGKAIGDRGYSGAAVSDWERGKSKIHQDDRLVLNAIIQVLYQCGAINSPQRADELLTRGNYRPLNEGEKERIFADGWPGDSDTAQAQDESTGTAGQQDSVKVKDLPAKRRKQLILLEKVANFWIEGVLQKSLDDGPKLSLEMVNRSDFIDWPWSDHFDEPFKEAKIYSSDQVLEAYLDGDRALLILGRPGSGKTMTLIQLAEQLSARALSQRSEPIPVILNLSSWAKQMQPLFDWIIEELTVKYQIPRQYGREWLQNDELVLLLDGYDQLPTACREPLAVAVNLFRELHGLTGLVVCSRIEEYKQISSKLRMGAAVEILSLSGQKIETYFQRLGTDGQELYAEIEKSRALKQLAQSPLMLGILWTISKPQAGNVDAGKIAPIGEESPDQAFLEQPYKPLFSNYVQRMFRYPQSGSQYGPDQILPQLSWLARKLKAHNQAVFLIEQIQPSWLGERKWRLTYMAVSGILLGLMGGFIMWLLWQFLRQTLPQLPAFTSQMVATSLNTSQGMGEFLTILLGNLLLGLLTVAIITLLFEYRLEQHIVSGRNKQRLQQMVLVGIFTGFFTFAVISWSSGFLLGAAWCVAESFMFVAAARFAFGWNYQQDVRPVEALGWSWRHALNGLLVGLVLAVLAEAIESLLYGYNGFTRTFITLAVAGFILGGLRGRQIREKSYPNQGIWLSTRNAWLAALIVAIPLALLTWLLRGPVFALIIGLLSGVIALSILGGSDAVKHYLLRILLHWSAGVPWRYARFLNRAARLTFLRKVGGGYIFMHNLLQDYFANLTR